MRKERRHCKSSRCHENLWTPWKIHHWAPWNTDLYMPWAGRHSHVATGAHFLLWTLEQTVQVKFQEKCNWIQYYCIWMHYTVSNDCYAFSWFCYVRLKRFHKTKKNNLTEMCYIANEIWKLGLRTRVTFAGWSQRLDQISQLFCWLEYNVAFRNMWFDELDSILYLLLFCFSKDDSDQKMSDGSESEACSRSDEKTEIYLFSIKYHHFIYDKLIHKCIS